METRDEVENLRFYESHEIKYCGVFCFFISINNIFCIVYFQNYKFIAYNVIDKKIINEIKGIKWTYEESLEIKHYLDEKNKRDLILIILIIYLKLVS